MSQSQRDALAPENYVLGRTESEYDRLRIQSRLFEPITERVLRAAGVGVGQACLDVGCAPGEIMRVLGSLVGPTGHVTGLDVDAAAGEVALDRLRAAGGGARPRSSRATSARSRCHPADRSTSCMRASCCCT